MQAHAEAIFDRMTALVRRNLPPGVSPSYFQGFVRRHRPTLVAVLDRHLEAHLGNRTRSPPPNAPDLWSASKRTAANASGERSAAIRATTAPAPTQSSMPGRISPLGQRSPAATMGIRCPICIAALATAAAFRRQPASVGMPRVFRHSVAPFGDGSTMVVPFGALAIDAGESEYREVPRGAAHSAPRFWAIWRASAQMAAGTIRAPRCTPTSTQVLNDSTSTMTKTSVSWIRESRPFRPGFSVRSFRGQPTRTACGNSTYGLRRVRTNRPSLRRCSRVLASGGQST